MKALTIKQPWAWCITNAGKNVENRSWAPGARLSRGEWFAIHAGKGWDADGWNFLQTWASPTRGKIVVAPKGHDCYVHGAIVAVCRFGGVVDDPSLEWGARGQLQWLLSDVRLIEPPVECSGQLGLWTAGVALPTHGGKNDAE